MLRKFCQSYVQSDEGFAVDVFEISWSREIVVLYMEVAGQRTLELRLKTGEPRRIDANDITHCKPPRQNEELDVERRAQIAERIQSAMELLRTGG
ncbi:MAG: hypothetical protein KGJ60_01930 [Verrucomicrobiota bacterium]|nr:hypothetical protein [Verrucomicrobiota bacterium]